LNFISKKLYFILYLIRNEELGVRNIFS